MGFFEDVKKSFNEGRQRAIDESYRRRKQEEKDRKSTRLNSSHTMQSRMPSSA